MSEQRNRRDTRILDRKTGEQTDWHPVETSDELLLATHESILQTLLYESEGRIVITRERFERTVKLIHEKYGVHAVPIISLSSEALVVEFMDSRTDELLSRPRA